ncbi:MAG: hypothetical protein U1F76_32670 [Candidatus Competibacteraceae bacterium]
MRNQTQLSRADLLICLAAHNESHLDTLAAALGYEPRPKPKEATKPPPQRPLVPTKVSPPEVPPSTVSSVVSRVVPKARYYRVVAQRTLEPTEVAHDEPLWFRTAEPYQDEQDLRAPADAKPPPSPELMRWSRLWPFLKLALGAQWEA